MTARNYSATAATNITLTSPVGASDTTLNVSATTGLPAAPFTAAVDFQVAAQEVVEVTAVAGTALTVARGYDGTTAQSHSAGATFVHSHTAQDFRDAQTHINASTGVHGVTGSVVGTTDTQALTNKTLTNPVINDANGNLAIGLTATASAVNQMTHVNAASGGTPQLLASGADANVSLNLVSKGTGTVQANGVQLVDVSSAQTLTNKTITTLNATNLNNASGQTDVVLGAVPAAPVLSSLVTASTGGSVPAGTYYGVVTAYGVGWETAPSNELTVTTTGTTSTITGAIAAALPGQQGLNLYLSTASGTEVIQCTTAGTAINSVTTTIYLAGGTPKPTGFTGLSITPTAGNGTTGVGALSLGQVVTVAPTSPGASVALNAALVLLGNLLSPNQLITVKQGPTGYPGNLVTANPTASNVSDSSLSGTFHTITNGGTAGGTFYQFNLGGWKVVFGRTAAVSAPAGSGGFVVNWTTAFWGSRPFELVSINDPSQFVDVRVDSNNSDTSKLTILSNNHSGSPVSVSFNVLAIGT